ncbi:MAG TPA: hypothetical protein PKM59_16120 [Thermodesulfobacteriota bacterium]|nr:hypothetical protein [Thermodesulfobacteriota bacterium]HNU71833.1 hypothetical protein [Thermodesulfobacteriota bacterium]
MAQSVTQWEKPQEVYRIESADLGKLRLAIDWFLRKGPCRGKFVMEMSPYACRNGRVAAYLFFIVTEVNRLGVKREKNSLIGSE